MIDINNLQFGDRIRINDLLFKENHFTYQHKIGDCGTLVNIEENHNNRIYWINWDNACGGWGDLRLNIKDGHGELITELTMLNCCELETKPFILKTDNIKTVFGSYTMSDGTVITAESKCHPQDEFNRDIGTQLCLERLVENIKKALERRV